MSGNLAITPAPLTVTPTAGQSMVYGSTVPTLTYTYSGLVNGDTSASFTGGLTTIATSSSNVGSFSIIAGTVAATGNYTIGTYNVGTLTVNPALLTITANSASKTYGTTLTFAGTAFTDSGLVNSNTVSSVTLTSTGAPATATVGSSPYAIVPSTATGSGLSDYTISYANGMLTVTPKILTASITAANKVYNGTTIATATNQPLSGLVNSDSVSLTHGTAVFATKNVGTALTVQDTGLSLTGSSAGNYQLASTTATTTANITPLALTITAVANAKIYDATTTAAATPKITSGSLQGTDTANFTESYASKNVRTNLVLTPSGTVNDGNSGKNYAYTFTTVSTGAITQASLKLTAVTNTKVYDGTKTAAAIPTVSGLKGNDTVTNLSETYASHNVGTRITLNVATYTINDGNNGGNYAVTLVANNTGVITTPATATFDDNDSTTEGFWIGVRQSGVQRDRRQRRSRLPLYASVIPAGNSAYTWAVGTNVPRPSGIPRARLGSRRLVCQHEFHGGLEPDRRPGRHYRALQFGL